LKLTKEDREFLLKVLSYFALFGQYREQALSLIRKLNLRRTDANSDDSNLDSLDSVDGIRGTDSGRGMGR
jgi:hypothetical protein